MTTQKYSRYITVATSALFFCLFACMERIDINTTASPPCLVIYGYITTDTTQHAIRITRSTGYFADTKPEGISHASVSISYDGNVIKFNESAIEPGLYLTSPDIYGIQGKTYTLHVSVDFNGNGKMESYEATSYLPFSATLDSASVIPSFIVKDFLQVIIWGNIPDESSKNFSFHLFRNGLIMNDSLRRFQIFQDDYITTKKFAALPIFHLNPERERWKISSGDTLTVQVESLTPAYATFIQNAQQEMWGTMPFFSGPPANIETNIHCLSFDSKIEISGFFTAYSINRTSTVYK